MKYVRLGRRGPRVSVVGLGFWQFGGRSWRLPASPEAVLEEILETARGEGVNLLDTAEIYGWGRSEELLGKTVSRIYNGEDVIVATKAAGFRAGEKLVKAAKASRMRLGRDIDLIQHHWPPPFHVDICRVVRGLEETVAQGIAHYYGLSNYPAELMEKVYGCTRRYEPASNQVQYSLAYRTPENMLLPHSKERGYTIIAWSPLAKGSLAGQAGRTPDPAQKRDPVYRASASDRGLQEALSTASRRLGVPRSTVALAWLVEKGVVPIPGTRRPQRVREYALAGKISLPAGIVEELDRASRAYMDRWGVKYGALGFLRFVPGFLQWIFIRGLGGV